jgi:lysophospholipase L1-like esterase
MKLSSNISQPKLGEFQEGSRVKRFIQNLGLVFGSLFVFFLLGEIVLRFLGYGSLIIYEADPKLFWKPVPNQNVFTKFGHKPVHVNSKGTRGRDFDENKPKNVYRILSLGDSRTFGWGLSEAETYSSLIENLLQAHFCDNLKIEVINAGVNAWSYGQIYVYLRDVGMRYNPDMVILADANLWTQFSEGKSELFIERMERGVRLKNLMRRSAVYHYVIEVKLQNYYKKYRTMFIPIDPNNDAMFVEQQKSDPMALFEQEIEGICNLIKSHHIKGLLMHIPTADSIERNNDDSPILRIKIGLSEKYELILLNLTKNFSECRQYLYLPGDTVHPNADGNLIIAKEIARTILYKYDLQQPTVPVSSREAMDHCAPLYLVNSPR